MTPARKNTEDSEVVAALTALRDAGLVIDRAELNRAWAELTGRSTRETS